MSCLAIVPVRRLGGSLLANAELITDLRDMAEVRVMLVGKALDVEKALRLLPSDLKPGEVLDLALPNSDEYWPSEIIKYFSHNAVEYANAVGAKSIILAHDCLAHVIGAIKSRSRHFKILQYLHGTPSHSLDLLKSRVRNSWLKGIYISDAVVSVSEHLIPRRLQSPRWILPHRAPSFSVPAYKQNRIIDILHVSSARNVKRPFDALYIINSVRQAEPNVRAIAVLTDNDVVLRFRESGVRALGTIQPERVHSLMSKSKILLLTSTAEGLPRVVMEALYLGAFPIITAESNMSGVVMSGTTGITFPAGDVESGAMSIISYIRTPHVFNTTSPAGLLDTLSMLRSNTLVELAKWLACESL